MVAHEPTPEVSAPHGRYLWGGWLAVTLAVGSLTTHIWMLLTMPMAIGVHLMTVAMSVGCLWCGIRLIHTPRVREWAVSAAMAAAMIAAHLAVAEPHHTHHPITPQMTHSVGASPAMAAALGLALTELIVAVAVIWALTREQTSTTNFEQRSRVRLPGHLGPWATVTDSPTPLIARENTRP